MPFFGIQYHPEKNAFEFRVNASHSVEAIEVMQSMARFFVGEARKSSHAFASYAELDKEVIYNAKKHHFSPSQSHYMEVYFFEKLMKLTEGYEEEEKMQEEDYEELM